MCVRAAATAAAGHLLLPACAIPPPPCLAALLIIFPIQVRELQQLLGMAPPELRRQLLGDKQPQQLQVGMDGLN